MDPVVQLDMDVRREKKVMGHSDRFCFFETSTARSSIKVALRFRRDSPGKVEHPSVQHSRSTLVSEGGRLLKDIQNRIVVRLISFICICICRCRSLGVLSPVQSLRERLVLIASTKSSAVLTIIFLYCGNLGAKTPQYFQY